LNTAGGKLVDVFITGFPAGMLQCNCYVLATKQGADAIIVDPGQRAMGPLRRILDENRLTPAAVLLTHGHIDHIWSAQAVADPAGVAAYIHPADRYMLDDPGAALGRLGMGQFQIEVPADVRDIGDGDVFNFGGVRLEARHTPGHTPGHCVFITDGILISGDLIFAGSVGRTDFPGGSMEELIDSIRRVVLPMDDDVVILSGHGPETTVGRERTTNPFVVADARGELPRLLGL
jgi:glyoxylase-like metal-dependent hydrolase (beta-lactamase superfamily II)